MFIYPDGRLFKKVETPVADMYDITRDRNGSLHVIGTGSSVVSAYDPGMTNETNMSIYFNGTYDGNPSYLAFLSDSNVTASANGIFIYYKNNSLNVHFMDNNLSENNASWNRPIAVNSSDWLIVASPMNDASKTPQPILLYKYRNGTFVNPADEQETGFGICGSMMGLFGAVILLYFCIRHY